MTNIQQDLSKSKMAFSFYQEIYENKIQLLVKQNEIKDQQIKQLKKLLDEKSRPGIYHHCANCSQNKQEQNRQEQTQLRLINLLKEKNQEVQVLKSKLNSQRSFSKKSLTEAKDSQQQFLSPFYSERKPIYLSINDDIQHSDAQTPQNLFDLSQSGVSEEFLQLYTSIKRNNSSFRD